MTADRVLLLAAAVAGVLLWRQRPGHRSMALALAGLVLVELGRAVTTWAKAGAPKPYEGAARGAWALDVALLVAWYSVTAIGVLGALEPRARRAWPLALAPLALAPLLWALYPVDRHQMERALVVVFRASIGVQLAAVAWWGLRWRAAGWPLPDITCWCALILAASSLASALGPWFAGQPVRDWKAGELLAPATWAVIGGMQAWTIRSAGRRSRSWSS